jgi:hypothetical protein
MEQSYSWNADSRRGPQEIPRILGRGHTKETGNCNATAICEKNRRFQAGTWFPD